MGFYRDFYKEPSEKRLRLKKETALILGSAFFVVGYFVGDFTGSIATRSLHENVVKYAQQEMEGAQK